MPEPVFVEHLLCVRPEEVECVRLDLRVESEMHTFQPSCLGEGVWESGPGKSDRKLGGAAGCLFGVGI